MKTPNEILKDFQNRLDSISDKKHKVREINDFAFIYGDNFNNKLLLLLEEGIKYSKEINDKVGEVLCHCNISFIDRATGINSGSKFSSSIEELNKMLTEIKDHTEEYAAGLNLVSYFHWFRGEYDKAFNLSFESIKHLDNVVNIGWNHYSLGVFYFDTKDFENSKSHYQKALDVFLKFEHEYGIARSKNGLGTIAILQNRQEEALALLQSSVSTYRKMGHYSGLSRVANDMGQLEKTNKNYLKAIDYFNESIELRKEIDHTQGLITSYTELGETFQLINDHQSALTHLQNGLQLAISVNAQQKEMRLQKLLYDSYKVLKDNELALYHFEKFFEIKSHILSDEAANNIKKVQTRFEKEKAEKEAELERFKNEELKRANTIIEQKNKDITDSINYARRIQQAILPPIEVMNKCFSKHFVLYKPKDIVSGDFYWAMHSDDRQTGEKLSIIAAVDCTGHGVPGAFMSMLGNTLLNQTITNPNIKTAADVLDYLNVKLPENLKSTGGEQNIRDGMDMGLCIFNFDKMEMQFSGANNPCWIIRENEFIELKGDKQAISASDDVKKTNFTNQNFKLEKNDYIYLLTDGFADQFGGENDKKFSYKKLKALLLEHYQKPCSQQKEILEQTFRNWCGKNDQIDDVCIIGIKI